MKALSVVIALIGFVSFLWGAGYTAFVQNRFFPDPERIGYILGGLVLMAVGAILVVRKLEKETVGNGVTHTGRDGIWWD